MDNCDLQSKTLDELIKELLQDGIDLQTNELLTEEVAMASAFQCKRIADYIKDNREALEHGMQRPLRFLMSWDSMDNMWGVQLLSEKISTCFSNRYFLSDYGTGLDLAKGLIRALGYEPLHLPGHDHLPDPLTSDYLRYRESLCHIAFEGDDNDKTDDD